MREKIVYLDYGEKRQKDGSFWISNCLPIIPSPIEFLSDQCRQKQMWKTLWELKCPPKVKTFLWKALHNGLTWMSGKIWNFRMLTALGSATRFWQWWLRIMNDLKQQPQWRRRASNFATILWKLWNDRNLRIFEGIAGTTDHVLSLAAEMIREYYRHHPH
ncbi:hypothetical protein PIB30_057393 [Stylosanthes scabra]|uniref:Reverse transcriptase zinc-binding domain-containing protein n=1 Tax=Stylosanthes scabra TaxID=79078 RepID=A0ABU6UM13_9FABA|nr:hypothetical protein [Stylosanthes scabra]